MSDKLYLKGLLWNFKHVCMKYIDKAAAMTVPMRTVVHVITLLDVPAVWYLESCCTYLYGNLKGSFIFLTLAKTCARFINGCARLN